MKSRVHTLIGYILIAIGLASFLLLCNSGGKLFDVGSEAIHTRARLGIIDNTTRTNQENIGKIMQELQITKELNQRVIEILNSRDALVIPRKVEK